MCVEERLGMFLFVYAERSIIENLPTNNILPQIYIITSQLLPSDITDFPYISLI